MTTSKFAAVSLIAVLLSAASIALAQSPSGGTRGGTGGASGSTSRLPESKGDRRVIDAPVSLQGQAQMQLSELQEELRLTPAQQGSWGAYSDRVLKLADDIARTRFAARRTASGESALQQFESLADVARNRMTAVEEIAEAGKALYAGLSPDQKRIADRRLAPIALQLAGAGTVAPTAAMEDAGLGGRPRSP